jgi:hypothetical protein
VLRKYRRARVGTRAASIIFRRYPGLWEVAVAWYNPPALVFWRRVIQAGRFRSVEELGGDGKRWSGPVLRFTTGGQRETLAGGYCRARGRRMTNQATRTSGTAKILPDANIVENGSPIVSRNGPVPNAATP